jgi:hypothetical protein
LSRPLDRSRRYFAGEAAEWPDLEELWPLRAFAEGSKSLLMKRAAPIGLVGFRRIAAWSECKIPPIAAM